MFEHIDEANLPRIGDTSSSNTPQHHEISKNITSDQEDSTLDPRRSGLVEEVTHTAINISANETQATTIIKSTRDESKSSLLGENSSSANEVAMEQETNQTAEANMREESQDSIAEIRQILSTPAVFNKNISDIDMSQPEQENKEQEVTLTAILEEINKSTSSQSDNSIREEQSHEPELNNMQARKSNMKATWSSTNRVPAMSRVAHCLGK